MAFVERPFGMGKKRGFLYRSVALGANLFWTLAICVALGAFLGTFVDNTFRLHKVFLLAGAIAGGVVGIWQCYRIALRSTRRQVET